VNIHVPHQVIKQIVTVVDDDQEITPEQRQRVADWLSANGVDPATVAQGKITLEYKVYGARTRRQFIGFRQYYLEDGKKVHAEATNDVVTFHRYVEQHTELEPDPSWEGWEAYDAHMTERRKARAQEAGEQ